MGTEVEYVMRVKLPSSGGYASCPSGDTEYEEAYQTAILGNLPPGFEVSWKTKSTWPVDRDGLTWVKLYCTNRGDAMETWRKEATESRRQIERMKNLATQIIS